ncbi:GMC oxidoreductase [Zasmidium cellare ATCC 36951]|uniref:GMC oxidoreductase n=1 Tax=Zasmidium cellare ATCC 36951 TaxID=1080233 RepID=A0A6A6C672_ZASCE|nr:GMC oxidoreductase [Zasmidium cellare ATCC 36951]KAF2162383.1 GMC oxidoreductase [Zasmidium cellare ATCC 36951]
MDRGNGAAMVHLAQPSSTNHDYTHHISNKLHDFIIIGGGTSGLVLANRLTEDPSTTVLVIEYGHLDNNSSIPIPYNANFNNNRDLYNISSLPVKHLNNKPFPVAAAATVGGGSVVNGMFFDRASALDYDAWEALGNPGWGWEGLLPYFINLPPWQWPALPSFVDAFREMDRGIEFPREGSDGSGVGVFWVASSQDPATQTRSDARTAYYDPVRQRTNLHLLTGTKVETILFRDKVAIGKEVILAAGAIFSPNILHLSGIGPREMLREAGIEVVSDLPGVGLNFQDHPTAYLSWNLTRNTFSPTPQDLTTNATFNARAKEEYDLHQTGPYTEARGNTAAFLPLSNLLTPSQIASLLNHSTPPPPLPHSYLHGLQTQHTLLHHALLTPHSAALELPFKADPSSFVLALQKPFSRGSITLNTTHPATAPPVVDYNTLSHPLDAALLLAGTAFTRSYFSVPTFETLGAEEVLPGANLTSPEDLLSALTKNGLLMPSFAHPSCSNAMMPEGMGGVVSPSLEVYGVRGLRVVDASVMPMIPATHLCATVYAVAEKGADLVKERWGLR